MLQGDDFLAEKVQMPRTIPNTYSPEIDSKWIRYSEWREYYKMIYGIEPPFYANLDGEVWYAYFTSPVDSKIPDSMIRVLSAEITQDYGRMFINELHYHLIETKEALKLGWKDIEEELFYLQDKEYIQALQNDETMVYCGEFDRFKDFLEYLRIEYDSTEEVSR